MVQESWVALDSSDLHLLSITVQYTPQHLLNESKILYTYELNSFLWLNVTVSVLVSLNVLTLCNSYPNKATLT